LIIHWHNNGGYNYHSTKVDSFDNELTRPQDREIQPLQSK